MANLLLGGVMQGLVGASGAMKSADTAYYVYVQKKAQGDEEGMRRAMGYASDHMNEANTYTEESKTALTDNIQAAREQEKAEQAESLEKARQESAEEKAEMQDDTDDANQAITNPVDTVEISPEAIEALQDELSAVAQSGGTTDVSPRPSEHRSEGSVESKLATSNARVTRFKSAVDGSVSSNHRKLNVKV